jgi:hypothetical protein
MLWGVGRAHADPTSCPTAHKELEAARSAKLTFDPGHARISETGKAALQPLVTALHTHAWLRLAVTGYAYAHTDPHADVTAKRRAEAVKWYLVDTGVEADRIQTGVGVAVSPDQALDIQFAKDLMASCAPAAAAPVARVKRPAPSTPTIAATPSAPSIASRPATPAIASVPSTPGIASTASSPDALANALTGESSRSASKPVDARHVVGADLTRLITSSYAAPSTIGSRRTAIRADSAPRLAPDRVAIPQTPSSTQLQAASPPSGEPLQRVALGQTHLGLPIPAPDDVVSRINTVYMVGLSYCDRRARRLNPDLSGRVDLTFSVDADGHVTGANAHGLDDYLETCITSQMGRWHFTGPSTAMGPRAFSISLALQGL